MFGMMNLMEASLDGATGEGTGDFAGVLAIVIGSLLAMLFTMTVLAFIRPEIVNRKQILAQLAVIVPPCVLLIILRLYAPEPVFKVFFWFMLAAYLLLMALYTRLFVKSYRTFKARMLAFYEEEDLVGQLQWINWTFWLGMAVGIAALLFLADSPVTGSILNVVFSVCFLLIHDHHVSRNTAFLEGCQYFSQLFRSKVCSVNHFMDFRIRFLCDLILCFNDSRFNLCFFRYQFLQLVFKTFSFLCHKPSFNHGSLPKQ